MKECSRCGKEKDDSEFVKRAHNKSGLAAWCKECSRIYGEVKKQIKGSQDRW